MGETESWPNKGYTMVDTRELRLREERADRADQDPDTRRERRKNRKPSKYQRQLPLSFRDVLAGEDMDASLGGGLPMDGSRSRAKPVSKKAPKDIKTIP